MTRQNYEVYDAKNFIYLTAMMKSSSSLIWLVLSALQEESSRPDPSKIDDVPANDYLPMTTEFFKAGFPRGGVFKNHAPIDYHNDTFLKRSGCKYVVLLRHPADHLAAYYCHHRKVCAPADLTLAERRTSWSFGVGQQRIGTFELDTTAAIDQLIMSGYLFKALIWMADWIEFRHPQQSRLIKFEDVIGSFEKIVIDLCWFVRGRAPDDDLMHYLTTVFRHETSQGEMKSATDKYPHGWTGRAAIWRDYFSAENARVYNEVVRKFLDAYPQGRAVAELYSDLMIDPGIAKAAFVEDVQQQRIPNPEDGTTAVQNAQGFGQGG